MFERWMILKILHNMIVFNPVRLLKYPKQYPFSSNMFTKYAFFLITKEKYIVTGKVYLKTVFL